jgi:hypothetical protein
MKAKAGKMHIEYIFKHRRALNRQQRQRSGKLR